MIFDQPQVTIKVQIPHFQNETRLRENGGRPVIWLSKATDIATNLRGNRPIIIPSIIGKRQDMLVVPKSG